MIRNDVISYPNVETLMSNPNYEERNSRKEMEMDL